MTGLRERAIKFWLMLQADGQQPCDVRIVEGGADPPERPAGWKLPDDPDDRCHNTREAAELVAARLRGEEVSRTDAARQDGA